MWRQGIDPWLGRGVGAAVASAAAAAQIQGTSIYHGCGHLKKKPQTPLWSKYVKMFKNFKARRHETIYEYLYSFFFSMFEKNFFDKPMACINSLARD